MILATVLFFAGQPSWTGAAFPAKLFILHSYEKEHVCGQPQHDGVLAALQENGFDPGKELQIEVHYMDTKRINNTPALIEQQAAIALERIKAFEPDVLVTLDDNAFNMVALQLVDTNIAIVFCGLNGQPESYNQKTRFMQTRAHPGHNITGVYEKLHIADAIRVHARMFPHVQKALLLTDPSPTGQAIYRQMELELTNEAIPITWELKMTHTWEGYRRAIVAANNDPLIGVICPAALLLKDKNAATYTAPQIFEWTIANSTKPELALNDAFVRIGLFGGAAVDFHAMGYQVGQLVAKVLNGHPAGDLAIEDARRYALAFNLKRAQDLGITIPHEILLASDEIVKP